MTCPPKPSLNREGHTCDVAVAQTVLSLLGDDLRADLITSLEEGIQGDAILPWSGGPLEIFRASLAESIRDVEGHPRGVILQRFLHIGPYHDAGKTPASEAGRFLTDDETARAISFIYSFVIRSFQGRMAELLAIAPVLRLLHRLRKGGELPNDARLFVGDTVAVSRLGSAGTAKGADFHVLSEQGGARSATVTVLGVGEVKSYPAVLSQVAAQLDRHMARAGNGMAVCGRMYQPKNIHRTGRPLRVAIVPARWRIPRSFHFDEREGGSILHVDPTTSPRGDDEFTDLGHGRWRIRLRWSHEALASAAYDMTFWYMEKVGEVIYRNGVPDEWAPMTPEEAGRNAAKMMLYYAMLRARSDFENQRAVALYNTYGFGYALGRSFRDAAGRREVLWPRDLREILARGVTGSGCTLKGWRRPMAGRT